MAYHRIIPRDLFNEAKLLKCIGRIALLAHEGKLPIVCEHIDSESGFLIDQNTGSGALFIRNLEITCEGTPLQLECAYNAKDSHWPLWCESESESIRCFDESGEVTPEFLEYLNSLRS